MTLRTHSLRNGTAAVAIAALVAGGFVVVGQVSTRSPAAQAATAHHHSAASSVPSAPIRSAKAIQLRNRMRKLWEDHITWTRTFIISSIAGLPDTATAAGRLLANQDDIGDAIKPFYGNAAGETLSALLREHILIAAEIVELAKKGDSAGVQRANARWHRNATQIARFLHAANPKHWGFAEMRAMMFDHLRLTLHEAVARLQQNWAADVRTYDRIHFQILHMADMLSIGIIRQFPARFSA